MVDQGLYALFQLHQVDSTMLDLQNRAGALDTGKSEMAELKVIQDKTAPLREEVKRLQSELQVLEDEKRTTETKLANFDKKLYDGSVTNAREITHIQQEVEMLKGTVGARQAKIDVLREQLPPKAAELAEVDKVVAVKQRAAVLKRDAAKKEYAAIQIKFEAVKGQRAAALKNVSADFARVYDHVRQKTGGTAMAVVTDNSSCSHCGMHIAEKTCEHVREGKLTQCEGCGRILFLLRPGV
jgi:predicted  nucleic acid-binding Zn-ribbon protein